LIYTVTLNPAIDKVLFLEVFEAGKTNRLSRVVETLGGKGTHVSINLNILGIQSTALGVSLGGNGRKIEKMLGDWGIKVKFNYYDMHGMESRTNYEIVEEIGRSCTMLTERGSILPVKITDDLIHQIEDLVKPGDMVVLTGDASNVEDQSIYGKLIHLVNKAGAKVFLDASGKYLLEGIKYNPFMIKPNLEELCQISGKELLTEAQIVHVIEDLNHLGIEIIALTRGEVGAIVYYLGKMFRVDAISVNVKNVTGCGDAYLAAFVAGLEKEMRVEEILKLAAGVSGAAAESEITAGFDLDRAIELSKRVKVSRIN
jgi:1-phosphofructokinase family hexose kinase